MAKKICTLVEDRYEDLELWYPKIFFEALGAEMVIIGPEKRSYQGKHGYEIEADRMLSDVTSKDFDGLLIPGGRAPAAMRKNEALLALVKAFALEGKPIAAICHAAWVIGDAGLAEGKRMTGYPGIKDDLVDAGADWEDEAVIVDGGLVTSRLPEDLPYFCDAFAGRLGWPLDARLKR